MAIDQKSSLVAQALLGQGQQPKPQPQGNRVHTAAVLPEMKRIKFPSEQSAAQLMTPLNNAGLIQGWDITPAGYVRYFDPQGRTWRDLVPYDLNRWGVGK